MLVCMSTSVDVPKMSTDGDTTEAHANRKEQDMPATHSEICQFISAINHMEHRMSSMKWVLADEVEARVAKKLKEADKQPALKKKGHQKQFQFNEDVRKRLTEASAAIRQMPAAVERAKTAIQEGMDLLNKRKKLIKIADRSDHGWATVEENVEDELAEDSDDEKCLFRLEARVGRKAKAAQAAKLKKRRSMASRKPQSSSMPASIASLNSQQLAQPQAWPQPATGQNAYSTVASQSLGPCFLCSKLGHFRKSCPLLQNSSGSNK